MLKLIKEYIGSFFWTYIPLQVVSINRRKLTVNIIGRQLSQLGLYYNQKVTSPCSGKGTVRGTGQAHSSGGSGLWVEFEKGKPGVTFVLDPTTLKHGW